MNALENYISSHNTTYFMNGMSLILVSQKKGESIDNYITPSKACVVLWIYGFMDYQTVK